ncbi:uncharacterized protein LOC126846744 [Adelges cooleyi]|uniref:uncharacterized protein LOC126846744 n=1 Tax=Adelges cooleyi TaxID=133065 RepID=UPI00217F230D|nr:uncharacterized protein LOC126846744 [Adelges cooleyi]
MVVVQTVFAFMVVFSLSHMIHCPVKSSPVQSPKSITDPAVPTKKIAARATVGGGDKVIAKRNTRALDLNLIKLYFTVPYTLMIYGLKNYWGNTKHSIRKFASRFCRKKPESEDDYEDNY